MAAHRWGVPLCLVCLVRGDVMPTDFGNLLELLAIHSRAVLAAMGPQNDGFVEAKLAADDAGV